MSILASKMSTIDKVIYISLVLLALLGMAITNFSPADAHIYWLFMTLVFAIGAIVTGWHKADDKKAKARLVTAQLIHWGSTLIAVMVVYAFLHSGQIQNETVSLIIMLILSLSTFLDGIHVGWHFYMLGVLLAISTVIITYLDEYIWIIAIIALVFIGLSFLWNKYIGRNKK
ncbi:hypothetical protein BJAS_P2515 [Bathymodiolus japonicus methanotrophic gill symbiont]|uniref:hypothetical protein n=1 Tax=Bathymodiolus japonicus methanotrophic gill symbiont TaxID=113269 RepID=UPI001B53C09A|nr:hypothetical protein [Bathymodiolus japonicus methanotrophic gill symbiont]GFO72347.1 hypothetical protein BJAS_P2515 [Bathymodiolus japonicus methanotrophic gill symbiont]